MAHTVNVVGLFRDQSRTPQVLQELTSRGFAREDVQQLTRQSAGTQLSSHIAYLGAPLEEARFWTRGVESGGTLLVLQTTEERAAEATQILERFGAAQPEDQTSQSTSQESIAATARGASAARGATAARAASAQHEAVIPIVEEELTVGKREVQRGGVRVYTRVQETPVQQEVRLREEHVTVERHAVDRPVTEADRAAFQEGTIELTETAEEVVVSKQARVVEEVVVGKETSERVETVRGTVRRTEVEVEELDGEHKLGLSSAAATSATTTSEAASTTTAAAPGTPNLPDTQAGGEAQDGTPDTRGLLEKLADAVTGKHVDDKTGKKV